MFGPITTNARITSHLRWRRIGWRPCTTVFADAEEPVAPRDAGWVELWDTGGDRRYGRGHLMLWPSEPSPASEAKADAEVAKDAAQPLGADAANLRAELRGFTFDGGPPTVGDDLVIRPEQEQDSYAVTVLEVDSTEEKSGRITLDWPDDRLPASLAELGGY